MYAIESLDISLQIVSDEFCILAQEQCDEVDTLHFLGIDHIDKIPVSDNDLAIRIRAEYHGPSMIYDI